MYLDNFGYSFITVEFMVLFYFHIARDELIRTLKKCGFTYQEFLLSPTCVSNGIVKISSVQNFPVGSLIFDRC